MDMPNVHAAMAKRLCVDANETAEMGGRVMREAVDAMKAISQSSRQIQDILIAIDEIAFQANLLALNAVMEASRPAEEQHGLAPVVAEVRKLAWRSAMAAKEIKALTNEASIKVEQGAVLVEQSGTLFEAIVVAIRKVDGMIDEIPCSARQARSPVAVQ